MSTDRSGLTDSPDWLNRLIVHAAKYAAEAAYENPAADFLTDPRMEWTRMEDREYPDRTCAWCYHPRNSDECQFAANHTPYVEMFA